MSLMFVTVSKISPLNHRARLSSRLYRPQAQRRPCFLRFFSSTMIRLGHEVLPQYHLPIVSRQAVIASIPFRYDLSRQAAVFATYAIGAAKF